MSTANSKGQLAVEGMEVHDITDNDLFRFFLNEEELSKPASAPCPSPSCSFSCSCSSSSSPDSSQSASMSSPEQDYESPPSSPFSSPTPLPFVEVKTEKDSSAYTSTSPLNLGQFWPASLSLPSLVKEEPKDILQSLNLGNLDFSSPLSLDMAVNALDQELKKRKCALNSKVEAAKASSNNSSAALSREDLLKLSTKSLETYAHSLGSNRSFSEEEERQLKRQRRLIKNRESAQLSRQRKRLYIEELEKKVTALTTENNELIKQVAILTTENASLREESFQYQSFIKQVSESQRKSMSAQAPVAPVKIEAIPESKVSPKLEAGSPVAPSSPNTSTEFAATVVPQVDNDDQLVMIEASEKTETTTFPLHHYLEHPEELRRIVNASRKKTKKRRKDDGSSSDAEENRESCPNASQVYFCPEAQEIKMVDKRNTRAASNKQVNNGTIISFLLPYASVYPSSSTPKHLASSCSTAISSSSAANTNSSQQLSENSAALLELYCQVLDTRTHTLSSNPLKPERVAAVPSA
jgi:hypothetical protein